MRAEEAAAAARVSASAERSVAFTTVTLSAKQVRDEARRYDVSLPKGLGAAWGRAVHRSIEGAVRGRRDTALGEWIRAVALDERLDDDQAAELAALVERIIASDVWERMSAVGAATPELPVMYVDRSGDQRIVTEGVIDVAATDGQRWLVIDWKSDEVSAEEWDKRLPQYRAQAARYGEVLEAMTGMPASTSIERVRVVS
jgi:ATP-dependent exoDNAse (exonuclease V) beta subunit